MTLDFKILTNGTRRCTMLKPAAAPNVASIMQSHVIQMREKIEDAQKRLKRQRDQHSEVMAGTGHATWNDWFM